LAAEGRTYVQKATYTGQEAFVWYGYTAGWCRKPGEGLF
jgi:hypothetical protein